MDVVDGRARWGRTMKLFLVMKNLVMMIAFFLAMFVRRWLFLWFCFGAIAFAPAYAATQTASPASCVNSNTGDNDWANYGNAVSSNDSYATVSLDDGDQSDYLQCTNFGFSIPSGATINGITVNIERKSTATNITDRRVRIVKGGSRGSDDLSTSTGYPSTDTVEAHGGATELWSETWTAADINSTGFGAALSVEKTDNSGGARTVSVDHIQIVVNYTVISAPTVTTGSATALTVSSATLNGVVSSNGASTAVTFDYGLTTGYGSSVTATASPLAAGATNSAVSASVSALGCNTSYHFRAKGVNSVGTTNGSDATFTTSACPTPTVSSINRTSTNPTFAYNTVGWAVAFNTSVSGVDASDFSLVQSDGATGASITSVSSSDGVTWTVTVGTGTVSAGALRLDLVDDDSILGSSGIPLGGSGSGNGNFTGQSYTLAACPTPSNWPEGLPVTCQCDNFGRASLNPSTIFGGNWAISNSDGLGNPYIHGTTGLLRLTENTLNNAKAATVPGIFPAAGNYISVEFLHYAYNGSGADGVAVTLSDYTIPAVPGAFGGSLGYAQRTGVVGFAGGWVGVALDEYGNYQNPTEGRVNGTGFTVDSVGVRGPGSGMNGYRHLGGTGSNPGGLGIDNRTSTTPAPGYFYQVIVDARKVYDATTPSVNVTVNRDSTARDGSAYATLYGAANVYAEANYALSQGWTSRLVPDYWKISFTGSTGSSTNIHEIGSLRVCAQEMYPLTGATASGFSVIDEAYGATAPAYQNFQTGHIYMKRVGTPFNLWVAALTGTGISTGYAAASNAYVKVNLVDNSDNGCGPDSARTCNATCTGKTAVSGGSQTVTFTSADKGVKLSSAFTLNSAWKNLVAIVKECTTSACTAFTSTPAACSVDSFSVRPTSISAVVSSDATNGGSSETPSFKAGSDTFALTATVAGVAGNPGGYTGVLKIDNGALTAVSPATVAGAVIGSFAAAASGTGSSSATGSSFTYSEVGGFKLSGFDPATDTTSPRGVYDGVRSATECASLTALQCDTLRNTTWTGIDSISTEGDCVLDSYSNAKVNGKYGCNFGLSVTTATIGRFIPDHFGVTKISLLPRNDMQTSPTTGSIGSGSFILSVASATGFATGNRILVTGAGAAGTDLEATVVSVLGTAITLDTAASTTASNVLVSRSVFSYMDEPMRLSFLVTAYNAGDNVMQNYAGDLVKLDATTLGSGSNWFDTGCLGGTQCMGLGAVSGTTGLSGRLAVNTSVASPSSVWTAGVGTFTVDLRVARAASPDGPYTLTFGAMPHDSDGVTLPAAASADSHKIDLDATTGNTLDSNPDGTVERKTLATTQVRFGRLWIGNAYGSDKRALNLPFEAQYWNGAAFVRNTWDSLTSIPQAAIGLGNYAPAGFSTDFTLTNFPAGPFTVATGSGSITLTPSTGAITAGAVSVVFDLGSTTTPNISWTPSIAPTAGAGLAYLRSKWYGAAYDRDPTARISFGIASGASSSGRGPIYIRESY